MNEKIPSERRAGVQSVETGMRVLRALTELGGAATLSAVARACAMPPPQAHRYLQSLIAANMAQQDAASGRYSLGAAALQLGLAALTSTDAFTLVDGMIRDLAEEMGPTIQISALGPAGPTVVRLYMGHPPVITSLQVGSVLPLLRSATGQVFLSFSPDADVAAMVADEIERAIMTADAVAAIRQSVRVAGFAQDKGTLIPGLHATAFPIFDLQGRVRLVATAIAAEAVPYRDGAAALAELGRRCAAISARLGWPAT
ncbi:DNA-binding IclR family transcriptional regulator [Sphingomonas vulcanisoli]|uniref:DNA-binding IclR family transcriptional regulator n=1 Tax=Sphingomonas vulcanisoli TaxID=1658060 RepID=A0ABX0TRJ4_9SPHN|nr:helix-turn-helix domain-containing protein [Sphingomonas vulcanisoli]NIJ08153.1 DNA-binding IclR family transcriptional regulator [Sphingomonas vulcanisoli]